MWNTQTGGHDLPGNRKKAKLTAAAIAILLASIMVFGCPPPTDPDPYIPPEATVSTFSVSPATTTVNKGGEVILTTVVTGTGSPSDSANWVFVGAHAEGTTLSSPTTGNSIKVTVSVTESSSTIQVKATSVVDTSKDFSVTITVGSGSATVSSISISPSATNVNKGSYVTLTTTVTGTGSPSDSANWEFVSSGHHAGTTLSSSPENSVTLTVSISESQGSIQVKATSVVNSGVSDTVTITVNPSSAVTAEALDFKTNAARLGLTATYSSGADVIAAMDNRINPVFYNPSIPVSPDDIFGIPAIKRSPFALESPYMAWIINGNNLIIHGENVGAYVSTIFNIAVIKTSDGTGWISGDAVNASSYNNTSYGNTYLRIYNTHSEAISISNLTDGHITTITQLEGYKVYVVIRMHGGLTSLVDFNQNESYKTINVIAVYPYTY
jgi:hypothetical protein